MTPRLDRIVPLLTLILAGLGVVFLLDAGPTGAVFNLGGDLPKIPIAWPLVLVLALLAAVGVEWILRAHPRFNRRMLTPVRWGRIDTDLLLPLWILPGLTPAAIFAFFRLFRGQFGTEAYLGVLLGTGLLLIVAYVAQHALLFGTPSQQATARTTMTTLAYILAFAIFAAVAFNRYRTLYSAFLIIPSVTMLSYELLRHEQPRAGLLAGLVALVLVESYWVLNYWPARFLLNAAALLLIFYSTIGVLAASDSHGLRRKVLVEYGGLLLVGLLVLGIASLVLARQLSEGLG